MENRSVHLGPAQNNRTAPRHYHRRSPTLSILHSSEPPPASPPLHRAEQTPTPLPSLVYRKDAVEPPFFAFAHPRIILHPKVPQRCGTLRRCHFVGSGHLLPPPSPDFRPHADAPPLLSEPHPKSISSQIDHVLTLSSTPVAMEPDAGHRCSLERRHCPPPHRCHAVSVSLCLIRVAWRPLLDLLVLTLLTPPPRRLR
jgi:hypothetical protein